MKRDKVEKLRNALEPGRAPGHEEVSGCRSLLATPWGELPANGVENRAIQHNMFQASEAGTRSIPGIRVTDGELVLGEAGLTHASLGQQRGVFSVQRAIDVHRGMTGDWMDFAELIAGLTAKSLAVPGLLCPACAALGICGTSPSDTHPGARLARSSTYSLPETLTWAGI